MLVNAGVPPGRKSLICKKGLSLGRFTHESYWRSNNRASQFEEWTYPLRAHGLSARRGPSWPAFKFLAGGWPRRAVAL